MGSFVSNEKYRTWRAEVLWGSLIGIGLLTTFMVCFLIYSLRGEDFDESRKKQDDGWSEFKDHSSVDTTPRQIVGYGILSVGYISNPIIAIDVADTEQIEAVCAQPDILEKEWLCSILIIQQAVTHSYVDSFICRCTERIVFQLFVRCRKG